MPLSPGSGPPGPQESVHAMTKPGEAMPASVNPSSQMAARLWFRPYCASRLAADRPRSLRIPAQPWTSGPLGVSLAFLSTHGPLAEYCTSRKGSLVSPSPTMLSSSSDWLMRCSRR